MVASRLVIAGSSLWFVKLHRDSLVSATSRSLLKLDQAHIAVGGREHISLTCQSSCSASSAATGRRKESYILKYIRTRGRIMKIHALDPRRALSHARAAYMLIKGSLARDAHSISPQGA